MRTRFFLPILLLIAAPAFSQETIDSTAIAFIKAETMERGQVMETALWLTDIHGPRLTGSLQLDAAQMWAQQRFESWGISAELQPWGTFGRGWAIERFSLNATASGSGIAMHTFPVMAFPKAWSPSTGNITAEVIHIDMEDDDALAALSGQLGDKIVLLTGEEEVDLGFEGIASRHDDDTLLDMANAGESSQSRRSYSPEVIARYRARQARLTQIYNEHPLAILEGSTMGGTGSIRVMGATVPMPEGADFMNRPSPWQVGVEAVPQFVVETEHYNRILRLLDAGQNVSVALDFEVSWTLDEVVEENVIAEIPGIDPQVGDEVVMLGAHLDSWHGGTGATDNASGSSVVMEAARALQAFYDERGQGPRRTIRFALWTGEEQGIYGSTAYVNERYATLGGFGEPATAIGPEHNLLSAYYNLDNGTGRIRGVYMQRNSEVAPIFRAWLDAFGDEESRTLTISNTSGTDHLPFDAAGLPGFQFIQDPMAYFSQTWHGTMDTYDHLSQEDLEQAAAVMAVFAHQTSERDERMPRKALELAQPEQLGSAGLDAGEVLGHGHEH